MVGRTIVALVKRLGKLRKRKDGQAPDGSGAPVLGQDEGASPGDARPRSRIVCSGCGHPISSSDARIEVAGRHQHTCVNPGGFVFRIGCYRSAPGCVGEGGWSDVHTWFAGTMWQISLCSHCGMHLGWGFSGHDQSDFYGLIVDRLEERDEDPPS